ncbi:MAG: hypothetical protein IJR36_07435 [Lachnospiraceae bacterium]|nr:hypothetical protein [Lachnospiraceae bacterium]MBR0153301.1 hypothetical protein [Lachnospiraceae bacterium]
MIGLLTLLLYLEYVNLAVGVGWTVYGTVFQERILPGSSLFALGQTYGVASVVISAMCLLIALLVRVIPVLRRQKETEQVMQQDDGKVQFPPADRLLIGAAFVHLVFRALPMLTYDDEVVSPKAFRAQQRMERIAACLFFHTLVIAAVRLAIRKLKEEQETE